ncbi:MAG: SDR family oxidoreductase [Dehalococcoidia bacterium]|jgi:2-deoxy-D-gluconate 3-dehydrogenase|nr:SDR family oxidoreductase [Dehalococcoidia bacterium]
MTAKRGPVFPELDLEGRVALVTGAGRGIGKAIAVTLAEAGAHVAVASRTQAQVDEAAAEVEKQGRRSLPLPTDVTDPEQVEQMVARTVSGLGPIDILVNSAGTIHMKPIVAVPDKGFMSEIFPGFENGMTLEEWDTVMDLNLRGTFLVTRAVAPGMIECRKGKVIIVTSTESTQAWTNHAAYASTKAALMMFTRVAAKEWARYGIMVNSLAPGFFRTAASEFSYTDDRLRESQLRMIPLRRFGRLRDLGILAVFLASTASDYVTGQTFFMDGGVSA